jgi:excisionase family DNA binding protein
MASTPRRVEFSRLPSLCVLPSQTHAVAEPSADSCPQGSAQRESPFLSVRDVAAYLAVSYNSVLGAIRNRSLPAHRFGPRGGTYRIAADDLIAYVEASRTGQRPSRRSENRKTGSTFKKLDGERLLNAWRSRGVVQDSPEERAE